MAIRKASAQWEGGLKGGKGSFKGESGLVQGPYDFGSRFGEAKGTNPEELIGAAHAACFSMALSGQLEAAGHPPTSIATNADVNVDKDPAGGFKILSIKLTVRAKVPGVSDQVFQEKVQATKTGCPISKALAAVPSIEVDAKLE
jgi:osmotically inducible protein OsmC